MIAEIICIVAVLVIAVDYCILRDKVSKIMKDLKDL